MTAPYRAMCAELLRSLENYPVQPSRDRDLCVRARALLAQPEPEGVSADEWDALVGRAWDKYRTVGHQGELFMDDSDFCNALDFVRSELAPWGHPTPQPPADGEVAASELVDLAHELRKASEYLRAGCGWNKAVEAIERAIELIEGGVLQRLAPVAVSERPWERDGWCDEQGRCWAWHPFDPENDETGDYWSRIPWHWIDDIGIWSHCLPASALPTPTPEAPNV